jgi:hypothetical protein
MGGRNYYLDFGDFEKGEVRDGIGRWGYFERCGVSLLNIKEKYLKILKYL